MMLIRLLLAFALLGAGSQIQTVLAEATPQLQLTLSTTDAAPGQVVTATIQATGHPTPTTITITLPPQLAVTATPADCQTTAAGLRCTTMEAAWVGGLAVQIRPDTLAQVLTLTATSDQATTSAQLSVTGAPLATSTPTATATATPWPTDAPAATNTPAGTTTPTPTGQATPQPDAFEPNNTPEQAAPITIGTTDKLTFWPLGDVDWFALTIKESQAGLTLTLATYLTPGLDTRLRLIGPEGTELAVSDDVRPTDARSQIAIVVQSGRYLVEVVNMSQARPEFKTYSLVATLTDPAAAPRPSVTPTPGAAPAWDMYAGNYDWPYAAPIPVGAPIDGLTFGCPAGSPAECSVPDFFTVTVKGGRCYTAETRDLAPGIDTNIIVYGPQRDQAPPWGGNDDASADTFGSRVHFCIPPQAGVLDAYLLIGQVGNRPPPAPIGERTYTLEVALFTVATTTPAGIPTAAPAPAPPPHGVGPSAGGGTPGEPGSGGAVPPERIPPTPTRPSGTSTPAPLAGITVEEIPLTVAAQPTSQPLMVVPLEGLACYDANQNRVCDVGEGISGLTVFVMDGRSGTLLGQALTDPAGRARVTVRVSEQAELVISVPSFAATQRVSARSPILKPILVGTVVPLPALLP